jgi:thiol-disulfide isomerase/thioredoxin
MRGEMCGMQPVATDARGRFELTLPWLRYDAETGAPRFVQPLAAFHPLKSLSTVVNVNLEDSLAIANLELALEQHDCRSLLPEMEALADDGAKNAAAAELAVQPLQGKPAPELDGLVWLNAPREKMRLADFRGKYVLLDFWTTWCGPCHADFPTIKLLHELYKGQGFAVIGVHDNSVAPDVVREHAKRQGLNFPVVIDTPDGKILSRYKPHGVRFYPSYLLIGPDGNVLLHDGVIPGPKLDSYMLEIVRSYLIE